MCFIWKQKHGQMQDSLAGLLMEQRLLHKQICLGASYGPYARALQRICAEEVFHAQHGESIIMALAEGTEEQKAMIQDALNRWWEALLMFFGPASKETTGSSKQDLTIKYKIRTKTNEEFRQIFFDKYIPRILSLGLTIPDPTIHFDEESKRGLSTTRLE